MEWTEINSFISHLWNSPNSNFPNLLYCKIVNFTILYGELSCWLHIFVRKGACELHVLHAFFLTNILDIKIFSLCLVKYPWKIWPKTNYEWNINVCNFLLSGHCMGHLINYLSCYSRTDMTFTCCAQATPMNRLPGS